VVAVDEAAGLMAIYGYGYGYRWLLGREIAILLI